MTHDAALPPEPSDSSADPRADGHHEGPSKESAGLGRPSGGEPSAPDASDRRVRVGGLGELIATIPYQLGYEPGPGVVVVAMVGGQVAAVLRIPAPDLSSEWRHALRVDTRGHADPLDWARLPAHLWEAARRGLNDAIARRAAAMPGGFASALLFGYEELPGDAAGGLDRMQEVCAAIGLSVLDQVQVHSGRWRVRGGDGLWQDVPEASRVAAVARLVMEGSAPVRDRGSVRAGLQEDTARSEPVAAAIRALADRLPHDDERWSEGRNLGPRLLRSRFDASRAPEHLDLLRAEGPGRRAIAEWLQEPGIAQAGQRAERTAAGLVLLRENSWRDALYRVVAPAHFAALQGCTSAEAADTTSRACLPAPGDPLALLCAVAPLAPARFRADICAVIALGAWCQGTWVLAAAAAEESRQDDPRHTMASMILTCLDNGLSAAAVLDRDARPA